MKELRRTFDGRRADKYYKHYSPYGDKVCSYCGEYADAKDHLIPLTYIASRIGFENIRRLYYDALYIVPCCTSCNSFLGATVVFSLYEKQLLLKQRLREKHRDLLESADWHPKEIEELGFNLASHILKHEAQRSVILARLAFPRYLAGDDRITDPNELISCAVKAPPPRPKREFRSWQSVSARADTTKVSVARPVGLAT